MSNESDGKYEVDDDGNLVLKEENPADFEENLTFTDE